MFRYNGEQITPKTSILALLVLFVIAILMNNVDAQLPPPLPVAPPPTIDPLATSTLLGTGLTGLNAAAGNSNLIGGLNNNPNLNNPQNTNPNANPGANPGANINLNTNGNSNTRKPGTLTDSLDELNNLKVCHDDGAQDVAVCAKGTLIQLNQPLPGNGCGPAALSALSSLIQAFLPNNMVQCCNQHDICYQTCNYTRKYCDDLFGECLKNALTYQSGISATLLSAAPTLMQGSVVNFGCTYFDQAQQGMCGCYIPDE